MKKFKSYISERKYADREKEPKLSGGKSNIKINPNSEQLKEAEIQPPAERLGAVAPIPADEREAAKQRTLAKAAALRKKREMAKEEVEQIEEGDYWNPDPKKDRTLSNRGAKLRAREDGATSTAVKDDPKKLKPGESYMDYAKRQGGYTATKKKPSGIRNKLKSVLGLNNSYEMEEEMVEEGMSLKDFKANRKKSVRRAASADAEKRGHVGKEWHNTGRKYSPDEAKSGRSNMSDYNRQQRYQTAEDPDSDNADTYPAVKTKNPKKLRKQKAMGEMMSFSQFMEARRMDKEGVDRGDSRRADRAEKAKASLAAVKKGEERKIKVSKKYGVEPSKGDTVEKRAHKRDFAGSRQAPKQKGAKETPQQTQDRRINAGNKRRMTHGWTSKEKAANRGMENAGSRFD
jgi:hypothetical protein